MYLIKKTKKPFGLVKVMLFGLFLVTYLGQAQITGIVFRDFNANGTKEANEPYVSGVTVTAYTPSGGACGSAVTTSPSSGTNYSLTGCSGSIRLEFVMTSNPNACSTTGIDGPVTRGSDVQFLTVSGAATANFPINYPGDYNTGAANTSWFNIQNFSGDPAKMVLHQIHIQQQHKILAITIKQELLGELLIVSKLKIFLCQH